MYGLSLFLGTVVGAAGTVIGGIIAMIIGKRSFEPQAFLAFAGGMMVSVVVFDMLQESWVLGGMLVMCAGVVAGAVFFALASPLVSHDENSLYSMGILVLAGIALHNFPEGLAIGSSLVQEENYAFSLSALMLIHNIPEGLAVCLPLKLSGLSAGRVVVLAMLTGLSTAGGALVGTALGQISGEMIAGCIAFAGGAMLYISLKELIPAANHKNKQKSVLFSTLGLCTGFLVTFFI